MTAKRAYKDRIPTEQALIAHTLAHEIGHALLLRRGDGVDNNADGRWDFGCDASGEYASDGSQYRSLMMISDENNVTISELQREFARLAAKQ